MYTLSYICIFSQFLTRLEKNTSAMSHTHFVCYPVSRPFNRQSEWQVVYDETIKGENGLGRKGIKILWFLFKWFFFSKINEFDKLGVRVNLQHVYWNRKRYWSDTYQCKREFQGIKCVKCRSSKGNALRHLTEHS